jgi:hypothetical protein
MFLQVVFFYRILPKDETTAVTKFLQNLLSCKLVKLPDEFFVHGFWSFLPMFMPSWTPYLECLQNNTLTHGRDKCAGKLKCPKRFGLQPWHSDNCKRHLWTNNNNNQLRQHSPDGADEASNMVFYKNCMGKVRKSAGKCIKMMDDKCRGTQFRATKTVRATMESVEDLIAHNPNARIIHLFRDPRPVAVSRMITDTYHGIYARNNTVREAKLYCSILLRDLRLRHRLEKKHPGVFFEVLYEDFVKAPGEYANSVYEFLDLVIPDAMVSWIRNATRGAKLVNKQKTPKWKRILTVEDSERILSICREFYDMVAYDFQ